MISQTTTAMDLYSVSDEDRDTVCCFLDFHEIKETPRKTQNPVTDLLVLGQEAQSTSAKAFKCKSNLLEKNRPCPSVPLRYCRTLLATCKCGSLGGALNWLNLCHAKVISGLIIVRYNNLPINLLYELGSFNSFPSHLLSLRF